MISEQTLIISGLPIIFSAVIFANPSGGIVNYGLVKGQYMLLEGSVPGPKKRLIMLRKPSRGTQALQIEVKAIQTQSQQG